MNNIILDIYFGSQLADNLSESDAYSKIFNINNMTLFVTFLFIILIITIFVFVILPKTSKNPKRYFERYLKVRQELERIDQLYARRKMSFKEYSFTQFHYAKEYEHIVEYLFQFPEYKSKLRNYKITATNSIKSEPNIKKGYNTADYFVRILEPVAVYYKKSEIYQALLDEGYSKEISETVVNKLEEQGTAFNTKEITEDRKSIELVDVLLEEKNKKKEKQLPYSSLTAVKNKSDKQEILIAPESKIILNNKNDIKITEAPTIIDLKDLDKSKSETPEFEEKITYSKYSEEKAENKKKGLFKSFSGIFKPQKNPSISDINDIFKNIEEKLKK